jgi:NAD-dependent dihydropyrimidine dehydrogenase PreA subunit
MIHSTKKFIAVFMLLWLPVFTGNALAASISMQMPQGGCHEAAMSHEGMSMDMSMDMTMDMANMDMGEHQPPAGEHSPSCSACGVCHLACTGYLAVPGVDIADVQTSALETTLYLVVFHSFTSAPLVPPPLARA